MFEELFDRGGLSLERLHALVLLAEHGSLIRAANGDAGLQSRYSHHLKELSAFFGVELTERVGKSIRLTANGDEIVQLAREHFQDLVRFKRAVQRRPPSFRLGAMDSLLQWLVIPTIAALRRPKGNVQFVLHNLGPDEIISRLVDQRLDFGLIGSDASLKGLTTLALCRVQHFIVVPQQIGFRRGLLTLKQALLDCPHASLPRDSALRMSLDNVAQSVGGHFDPEIECDSVSQCVAAVQTGRFAAVLPIWSWDPTNPLSHTICEDPLLETLDQNLVLAWNPVLIKTRGAVAKHAAETLARQIIEDRGQTIDGNRR